MAIGVPSPAMGRSPPAGARTPHHVIEHEIDDDSHSQPQLKLKKKCPV